MVFKNLTRRKGRTIVTLVGITIGVTAIIAPGAMAVAGLAVVIGGITVNNTSLMSVLRTRENGCVLIPGQDREPVRRRP